jgi:hypothetical protein
MGAAFENHMGGSRRIDWIVAMLVALVFGAAASGRGAEPIEVIAASRGFTIDSLGSPFIRDWEVRVVAGTSQYFNGFAEFDVPRRATNMQALLTFGGDGRPRIEVFAYPAGATNGETILQLPREFIGSVTTNRVQEFDVTPLMAKFAGSRLGIALPLGQEPGRGAGTFTNFTLQLFAPGTMETRPRIRWLDYVPPVIGTNSIRLRAEVSHPDSTVSRIYLFDNGSLLATNLPAEPLPAGTNIVEFTVTNISQGKHYYNVQATSTNRPVWSELRHVTYRTNRIAKHRWLGSKADSESFYVIDAAGRAHVWGRDDFAQLSLPTIKFGEYGLKKPVTLIPPVSGQRFVQIAAARTFALALMDNGALYICGNERSGWRLLNPPALPVRYFWAIAAASYAGGAIDQDGTIRGMTPGGYFDSSAYFWREVQTENGSFICFNPDFPILPPESRPLLDFAGDGPTTYAIGANHQFYSWAPTSRPVATAMTLEDGTGFQRIASSPNAALAVDDLGRLWTWRTNTFPGMVAMPAGETNWLDITITTKLAMALSANGNLYAWGEAAPGVWNDPKATIAKTPELVRGLPDLLDPNATGGAALLTSRPRAIPDGLSFNLVAPAGQNVVIQSSSDFVNWNFYTNFPAQVGIATVTLGSDSTSAKFFRIAE